MRACALLLVASCCACATTPALAGEGMWLPQQLPQSAAPLTQAGLKLPTGPLADGGGEPLGAVVSLGGCTGSFVSPQGLVLTNHHCAHGAIQLNSTAQKNLMHDGFAAAGLQDELPAGTDARIYVSDTSQDVTARVKSAIAAAADGAARVDALTAIEATLVSQCEAPGGYRCRLYSYYGGNQYRLFRDLEIKDVRLVYAPPGSVGNFGGAADNMAWPRQAGDFAFYRAYVGKDGKPTAYASDNVPYVPEHWLRVSDQPLAAGAFVMVAGFPASTNRYALADDMASAVETTYPAISQHLQDLVALANTQAAQNPDIGIKYAGMVRGWQGALKGYQLQRDAFQRTNALAARRQEEEALLAWLRERGDAGRTALEAHDKLAAASQQARASAERDLILSQLTDSGALGAAVKLYRLSLERPKPDATRAPGFQRRDEAVIESSLRQFEQTYVPAMDHALQRYWLGEYLKLPPDQRVPALDQWLGGSDAAAIDRTLARLDQTRMGQPSARIEWLNSNRTRFEKSKSPDVQLAVALMPALLDQERTRAARNGEALLWRSAYLQALVDYRASRKQTTYPDANGSLRVAYGKVVAPTVAGATADTNASPFTRVEDIAARSSAQEPFDSPKALLDAVAAHRFDGLADKTLRSVPVAFSCDVDIAGGNSGSPVLDASGRLVGVVFDGNQATAATGWLFDPVARAIAVDQRYLRWVMREVLPAPRLLQEMGAPAR